MQNDPTPEHHKMHRAMAFSHHHPEDSVDILSTAGAMMAWGAQQKSDHGFAFFTLGMENGEPPVACAAVLPMPKVGRTEITTTMLDQIIAVFTNARNEAAKREAASAASQNN